MTAKATNTLTFDETSDFYSHFFIHHPWAKWVFDVNTLAFLEVNQAAIDIYGYTRDEFLSMTIKDIRTPEDVTALENHLATTGQTYSADRKWRHLKKDGTCIWVNIISFQTNYKGLPVKLVTINDVTKAYEQEIALAQTNLELVEYKKAINASSIVSITDRQGIIEYANDNFATLTGYTQAELVGSSHNIINSGYHPHKFWQQMWNTIMNGKNWRGEVCNRKKNGELYWVDSFIIPVKNNGGRIDRIFSIRIDITDRKKKECEVNTLNKELVAINLELTESKKELEKLSLVAKLTNSEVMILNNKRQIIWVNDAFIRNTGYSLTEAFGVRPSVLLRGPNSSEETIQKIISAIDNRLPFNTELVHYSKFGKEFQMIADGQPVLDEKGELLYYVMVETDITDLKEKQKAIIDSEIKLNAFFSGVAHLHLLVDRDLKVVAQNQLSKDFAENVMRTTVAEGDYLPIKLIPQIRDAFTHFAMDAINGKATLNRCVNIVIDNVDIIWQVNYLPAYDREGNIIGCAFTAVDITESKKAEARINRQNAILREIAWKQSHIVRAPLANILAITNLLKGNIPDESLNSALMHEAEKLDDIIKDIVDKTVEANTEY